MTSDEFVSMCLGRTKKARKERKKKGVRVGFSDWGFSSVPGGNISGPMPVLPGTGASAGCGCGCGGDGGGCCGAASCCGEATEGSNDFTAYLEGLGEKYPNSDVVSQVRKMFADMQSGKYDPLYCSADGISTHK